MESENKEVFQELVRKFGNLCIDYGQNGVVSGNTYKELCKQMDKILEVAYKYIPKQFIRSIDEDGE